MTLIRVKILALALLVAFAASACGKDKKVYIAACDEVQAYQLVVPSKRIEIPEGLDELNPYLEMPVPQALTPPRPEGSQCIDNPPLIRPQS